MAYSHILVLHTDNGSVGKAKYIIDIVQGLRESGYKVYLLTTNNSLRYINDVQFKLVLSWFPKTFLGYYRDQLYGLRSVLLAIYACWNPPKGQTCMVISDGASLVVPILKYFKFHVSFIYYMVSFHKLVTSAEDVKPSKLEITCMQCADEIILPSFECQNHLKCIDTKKKVVLPPCVEDYLHTFNSVLSLQLPELNKLQNIFTIFGQYTNSDNLYMVLAAFIDLHQMLPPALFNNTRLVFVGRCESEQECEELSKFNNIILTQDAAISEKIYLYDTSDVKAIKSFLHHSIALIDTNEKSLFNVMLLRAQDMGKPVICFESGYNREVIVNELTGVFIAKQVHSIRNSMHRFITKRYWAEKLGVEARRSVRDRFSMCTFRECISYFASKAQVVKYNSFLPIDNHEFSHWNRSNSRTHYDHKICED